LAIFFVSLFGVKEPPASQPEGVDDADDDSKKGESVHASRVDFFFMRGPFHTSYLKYYLFTL